MRPRKRVVLIDANETGRNVMEFVLGIWGYRVAAFGTAVGACEEALMDDELVAIVVTATSADRDMLMQLRLLNRYLKVFSLEPRFLRAKVVAEVSLPMASPMTEIRERLRILSARKRGPKKGKKREKKLPGGERLPMLSDRVVNCNRALGL